MNTATRVQILDVADCILAYGYVLPAASFGLLLMYHIVLGIVMGGGEIGAQGSLAVAYCVCVYLFVFVHISTLSESWLYAA